jgi:heat shock protein HslJ
MMKPSRSVYWIATAVFLCACGKAPPAGAPGPGVAPTAGPPTLDEAAVATYRGIEEAGGEVTLADGLWEGRPFREGGSVRPAVGLVRELLLKGDLDRDGSDESVVFLWSGSGGPGTRAHVAVLDRSAGEVVNVATRLLGDRVQVRHAALDGDLLRLDIVNAGPGDAACCPGELTSLAWGLGDGALQDREPPMVTGRLGLPLLAGSAWRLSRFTWSEEAPASSPVTLAYEDGRLSGNAGCNDYWAAATQGSEVPGTVEVAPPVATRKLCPPAEMQVEDRFLQQLGSVRRFGFMNGQLMLSYDGGEMLFDRVGPPPSP